MIDVNGTRHHTLLGALDWRPLVTAAGPAVSWRDALGSVALTSSIPRFSERASRGELAMATRRGAGADRFGNIYWIDDTAEPHTVRVRGAGSREAWHWWSVDRLDDPPPVSPSSDFLPCPPPEPRLRPGLRGLAVTTCHYLIVGTLDPGGLLVFDLHQGGPPEWLAWPVAAGFAPWDITSTPSGHVVVLDRGASGEGRLWALDRYLQVTSGDDLPERATIFEPCAPVTEHRGDIARATDHDYRGAYSAVFGDAVAVCAVDDAWTLVLSTPIEGPSVVHFVHCGVPEASLELSGTLLQPHLTGIVRGHDMAFVPTDSHSIDRRTGILYLADTAGVQSFAFDVRIDLPESAIHSPPDRFALQLRDDSLPMGGFTGKALIVSMGSVFYDEAEAWRELGRFPHTRYETAGTITLVLDGKEPGCSWHRLMLDACVPSGTAISVDSRADDERAFLPTRPWHREPTPYRRSEGSELPLHAPFGAEPPRAAGTYELLFQEAVGRYVELRIELRGNGRASPHVRALRAYYPRFSYVDEYLPAIYRGDRTSASSLDRFLANSEGLLTALEGRVAAAEALFDARTTSPEYVDWLAGWLGALLDPQWDVTRRRLLVRHAYRLYRHRGTKAGLAASIRLAIDPCPDERIFDELETGALAMPGHVGSGVRIIERFALRRYPGVALGDPAIPETPDRILATDEWTPSHGSARLHQRYREFLLGRGVDAGEPPPRLSPVLPSDDRLRGDWRDFLRDGVGFRYAEVTHSDEASYREFLARRYSRIERLNHEYSWYGSSALASFDDVKLPAETDFPDRGARLADWIEFVSSLLPTRRNAHRFIVLVPTDVDEPAVQRKRRLEQVAAVVDREKPAHTVFEVRAFWELFQVGTARVGYDTAVGEGSRYVSLILGSGAVGDGFLSSSHPMNVRDRWLVGRDAPMEHPDD